LGLPLSRGQFPLEQEEAADPLAENFERRHVVASEQFRGFIPDDQSGC